MLISFCFGLIIIFLLHSFHRLEHNIDRVLAMETILQSPILHNTAILCKKKELKTYLNCVSFSYLCREKKIFTILMAISTRLRGIFYPDPGGHA